MSLFEVKFDQNEIERIRQRLGAKARRINSVMNGAINDAYKPAVKEAKAYLKAKSQMKVKYINKMFDWRKCTKSHPFAVVYLKKRYREKLAATYFSVRKLKKGYSYKAYNEKGIEPSSFRVTFDSGHEALVKRRGKERYPLDEIKVPAVLSKIDLFRKHLSANVLKRLRSSVETRIKKALLA